MGNTTGLEVKVRADISDLKSKVTEAKAQVAGLGQSATVASGPIAKMGEEVTKAAAKTTVMASATSTLKSNLLSIINPTTLLVTGLTAIGVALYKFVNQEREADKATKDFIAGVSQGSKAFVEATNDVNKLQEQIAQFHKGVGDKKDVVKQYNDTLGQLTGKVNSVYEAERLLNANASNYINAMTAKGIATQAFAKGNELIFKQITNQLELERIRQDLINNRGDANYQKGRVRELEKENDEIYKQVLGLAKLKEQALSYAKAAESQIVGRGLYGDITKTKDLTIEPKELIIKPQKIKIEAKGNGSGQIGLTIPDRIIMGRAGGVAPGRGDDPYGTLAGRRTPEGRSSFEVEAEKRKKALLELSNIVTSVLSPALDSVFDNIGKGANKVVQSLGNVIKQLSIAVFKALALQAISSLITGGGFNVGNALKSVLGGFATGTRSVGQAGVYNVGERGPERIFLPQGASVQPNNELQAYGGGGINLMPSIAYDGTMFRIFLNRVDAQISRNG